MRTLRRRSCWSCAAPASACCASLLRLLLWHAAHRTKSIRVRFGVTVLILMMLHYKKERIYNMRDDDDMRVRLCSV